MTATLPSPAAPARHHMAVRAAPAGLSRLRPGLTCFATSSPAMSSQPMLGRLSSTSARMMPRSFSSSLEAGGPTLGPADEADLLASGKVTVRMRPGFGVFWGSTICFGGGSGRPFRVASFRSPNLQHKVTSGAYHKRPKLCSRTKSIPVLRSPLPGLHILCPAP